MGYVRLWWCFYSSPNAFAGGLAKAPAPQWGFSAALQRAVMDSLLLYLPLTLLGRLPPERSYLPFIPDERYYAALIGLTPPVLIAAWLISAALMHLLLRLSRHESDMDQILGISGFATLAIGSVLLVWDWTWLLIGGLDQYLLGTSHLLIDIWGIVVCSICFRRILGTPLWLAATVNVAGVAIALPLAIMFMRSPL